MADKNPSVALTFDDVMLLPNYSEVLPREVKTQTKLTRSITLNIPILSAAMDTVTESRMAIALARDGGMGIIHKNLSIEQQRSEVERVKKYESGLIQTPITLSPDHPLSKAVEIKLEHNISGLPITKQGKLVGILTNRDLRFETNLNQTVGAVMTKDGLITAPEGTTMEEAKKILHKHRIEKLPVVDQDGNLKGLITVKDIQKRIEFPDAAKDALGRLRVGAAVEVGEKGQDRVRALVDAQVDVLVVDSAHGHSRGVLQMIEWVKKNYSDVDVIGGNIGTADGAKALMDAGCDAIKVGVGPGSICTTRMVSGVGVPQWTAIRETTEVAHKKNIPVISDGGIKFSGDIVKALAAGASCTMLGNLFAGTDEAPGEVILYQGRSYKVYRGMGSLEAMEDGSKDRYFQENVQNSNKLVPEGIVGRVPYKGSVSSSIFQLVGGLRSGMGYIGADSIARLQDTARFVRISTAGLRESHAHDVMITKEAPNYVRE